MTTNNSSNIEVTKDADGGRVSLGVTKRILRWFGADITIEGTGTETHTFPPTSSILLSNQPSEVSAFTAKTTPVDADMFLLEDSADSNNKKKTTWANFKTVLGAVYAAISHAHAASDVSGIIPESGWVEVSESWSYASATTITIPTDGTTKYKKGMKIRFKQGGAYKYLPIHSVAATLLTTFTTSDYSVANSAITDVAYSFIENPIGWPDVFNWTPTITGFSSNPTNLVNRFRVIGKKVRCDIRWATGGTSNAITLTFSLPGVAATITNMFWISLMRAVDNGTLVAGGAMGLIASGASVCDCYTSFAGGTWTASGTKYITIGNIEYEY